MKIDILRLISNSKNHLVTYPFDVVQISVLVYIVDLLKTGEVCRKTVKRMTHEKEDKVVQKDTDSKSG